MQQINEGQLVKVSNDFYNGIKILETSKNWKLKEEKPVMFYEMEVEGRTLIKAIHTLNLPFQKVCQFFSSPGFFQKLNDNVVKHQIKFDKQIDGKPIRVIHNVMKLPGPISNREIVAVNTIRVEGDKGYFGNRSCGFPLKPEADTVRAEVHIAGFIVEKVDAGKTKVTNISDIDVKGSIPGFVKNAMASKRAEMMSTLEKKIKE